MRRKDCGQLKRAIVLALGLVGAAEPVFAATLSLWGEAVVDRDVVTVADVCRITDAGPEERAALAGVVIVAAPGEGASLVLAADEVRSALRAGGHNLATLVLKGSATCAITRPRAVAAQTVVYAPESDSEAGGELPPRCLRDVIQDFFTAEAAGSGGRVLVHFGRASEKALDLCEPEFTFRIQRTSGQTLGMIGLKVTVYQQGDEVRTLPLLVEVSQVAPVVVAARGINLGAVIQPEDVRVAELTFARREPAGARDVQSVIGQRATRFIAAGAPVHLQDLEPVPLVKRGQLVDVCSQVGNVSIVTAAQANSDGAYGDIVTLRADNRARARVTAVVTGPGRVRMGGGEDAVALGGQP